MDLNINTIDLIIIVVYLIGILMIGIFTVRLKKMTSESYFLAGRGLGWVMVGASLFASNISTIHLVGLAASGYNEGLVWGNFEW
ncbi:MAG: sodium/glucose cotransporter, partial [Bacteroidales bacterium]|nr:sodium/glucose cotransporter [Bacteroidales bacterium]